MPPPKRKSTASFDEENHENSIREPGAKRGKYDLSRSTDSETESAQIVSEKKYQTLGYSLRYNTWKTRKRILVSQ